MLTVSSRMWRGRKEQPVSGDARRIFLLLSILFGLFCLARHRWYIYWSQYNIFERLFAEMDGAGAVLSVGLTVAAWLFPPLQRGGRRLAAAMATSPMTVVALAFGLFAFGSVVVYHEYPVSMDEFAPLFQAATFASGHLSWTYSPELLTRIVDPQYLSGAFFFSNSAGQMASAYWPGFALIIAPFYWFGVPWLVNPAISSLGLLLVSRLAEQMTGSREAGGWAMLFCVASPAYVVNAMSMYSMNAHLVGNVAFALLLLRPSHARAFYAGLLGGLLLALHNPVPHALFAVPWVSWLLFRRGGLKLVAILAAAYLPGVLVLGFGWAHFTQGLVGASHSASAGEALRGIEYWQVKLAAVFSLPNMVRVFERVTGFCKLWVWAVPGLPLLALAGVAARERAERTQQVLFWSCVCTVAGYMFVPFNQGHGWGFRYFHSAWGVLPVLAACFLWSRRDARTYPTWAGIAGGLALGSLLMNVPMRLMQVEHFIGRHLAYRIEAPAVGHYVVTVRNSPKWYTLDLVQNLPGSERVIYLVSSSMDNDTEMVPRLFPGYRRLTDDQRGSLWAPGDQPDPK